jgi:Holliday junction resolvasome RuvABC endonuclease subunit
LARKTKPCYFGVDTSLSGTLGYSLMEEKKLLLFGTYQMKSLDEPTLDANQDAKSVVRAALNALYYLSQVLTDEGRSLDEVVWVLEKPYFNRKNPKTYGNHLSVVMIMVAAIMGRGHKFFLVDPNQAKMALTNKGGADKDAMVQAAEKQYKPTGFKSLTKPKREAVADAIGVTLAGVILYSPEEDS